ncbi:hypothetical protein GTGU_04108 [Trabulsiella guamensis ATCC 49490]|uniref:Derepression protein n=1 Tax=Trabulsiella guamensis ATCC 49490 TaxID=1005994 RepID=A0A084ZQC5_9ENTR|nr:derepression protein [Trabulsiella guamensis]KFB99669.1 hypothetical protein GTGU_04108 [Trabulsiella guamensis ATCC 49490]
MGSHKTRARRRAAAAQNHRITEINRRLFRAEKLASCMYFESLTSDSILSELCIPAVLSYLAEDLRDVQQLINDTDR